MIRSVNAFKFRTEKQAENIKKSIETEIKSEKNYRSEVRVSSSKKELKLKINANDLTAFRAVINTYIRLIQTAGEVQCLK